MGEKNKWPQGMVKIFFILKEVEINVNIEINISSLSWSEKKKAFNLPCEVNKNGQAKAPAPPPPPPISNGGPLSRLDILTSWPHFINVEQSKQSWLVNITAIWRILMTYLCVLTTAAWL